MNDRSGLLIAVYGVLLGWGLCAWWRQEKRSIVYDAVQKVYEEQAAFDERRARSTEPPADVVQPTTV